MPRNALSGLLNGMAVAGALAMLLIVSGCSAIGGGSKTPAQAVYGSALIFNGVLDAAVAYESYPRCSDTQPAPCSDTKIVARLRAIANAASLAIELAEQAVVTAAAARAKADLAPTDPEAQAVAVAAEKRAAELASDAEAAVSGMSAEVSALPKL